MCPIYMMGAFILLFYSGIPLNSGFPLSLHRNFESSSSLKLVPTLYLRLYKAMSSLFPFCPPLPCSLPGHLPCLRVTFTFGNGGLVGASTRTGSGVLRSVSRWATFTSGSARVSAHLLSARSSSMLHSSLAASCGAPLPSVGSYRGAISKHASHVHVGSPRSLVAGIIGASRSGPSPGMLLLTRTARTAATTTSTVPFLQGSSASHQHALRRSFAADAVTKQAAASSPEGASGGGGGGGVTQKIRYLWREYGVVGISTYAAIYVSTLATLYAAIIAEMRRVPEGGRSGVLDSIFGRLDKLLAPFPYIHKTLGLGKIQQMQKEHPRAAAFAMAWVLAKLTEPLRLALALAVVPRIASLVKVSRCPVVPQMRNPTPPLPKKNFQK